MWIPAWLWRAYSRLYSGFGGETFGFSEARALLSLDEVRARVVLSRLRRAGYIVVFERKGRMRMYRTINSSLLAFAEGSGIKDFSVPQGRYVPLILLWCRKLMSQYGQRLKTIVLYGSVARGSATSTSDVDFMLIVDGLDRNYGRRIEELVSQELDPILVGEKTYLVRHGYSADLSNIVYSTEESRRFRLVYLDIIHDGRILFDYQNHFGNISAAFKSRLDRAGTRKVDLGSGGWYWELKPNLRFGERLEL